MELIGGIVIRVAQLSLLITSPGRFGGIAIISVIQGQDLLAGFRVCSLRH